nr:hypothetical protein Iba_chr02fCG6880 [Ipomoea batatas]
MWFENGEASSRRSCQCGQQLKIGRNSLWMWICCLV